MNEAGAPPVPSDSVMADDPRLFAALHALRTGIALFDSEDRLVWCNQHFRYIYRSFDTLHDILGLSYREILTLLVQQREIAGEQAAVTPDLWVEERLAAHRKPWGLSEERLADGRWVEVKERALPDGGMIGLWSDITNRVQSTLRLEEVVESTADGFAIWTQADRLAICNRHFAERFGDAALNDSFQDTLNRLLASRQLELSCSDRKFLSERLRGRRQPFSNYLLDYQDGRHFIVTERRTRDGGIVTVMTDVTEMKTKEQELIFRGQTLERTNSELEMVHAILEKQGMELVALAEDLDGARQESETLRRRAEHSEHQLRLAHDALEDRVVQRTRQLTEEIAERRRVEEELKTARDQAERANRAKTEFLANMSHELRTPLNAVIGFSEILQNAQFGPLGDERYEEYARTIHDSGEHLLRMISDIMDLSAIESGTVTLEDSRIDLREAVTATLRLIRWQAQATQRTLHVQSPSNLPALRGDETRVKQILLTLISHALKVSPVGGIITLTLEENASGGLELSVADTGPGMNPAEIAALLGDFGQLENPFVRQVEGLGLGLALARHMVALHGGLLSITSAHPDEAPTSAPAMSPDQNKTGGTLITVRFPPDRTCRTRP